MLLSIDQEKIDKQLEVTKTPCIVTSCNLETENIPYQNPPMHVGSSMTGMPPDLIRARDRVLTLRQRLIDRGQQPLSPDALEREIDETRGR